MINVKKDNGKVVITKSTIPTPKYITMPKAVERIKELEAQLGKTPTETTEYKGVAVVIPTPPQHSPDPKVQAILDSENRATSEREQAVSEYAKLSPAAKKLMAGQEITTDNVSYAKRFAEVHQRAEEYGNQITLETWNKGLDAVVLRMDEIDQWAKERQTRQDQARKEIDWNRYQQRISNKAPVHVVKEDEGYYLLLDDNKVYCQKDDGSDGQYPIILAKLRGESRGSKSVSVSIDNPAYLGAEEYRSLLEQRPAYDSIRRAYLSIDNTSVKMDFSLATSLFD